MVDPVTGRKFGKSEGNAIWLAGSDNGSGNYTSIFDFYQFWLNQPDDSVEYFLKIYTLLEKPEIEEILSRHFASPEQRIAQKALARSVTEVVHGKENADAILDVIADAIRTRQKTTTASPRRSRCVRFFYRGRACTPVSGTSLI